MGEAVKHRDIYDVALSASVHAAPSGALSSTECNALWQRLMEIPSGGIVVEVGCQLGRSSSLIMHAKMVRGFKSIHIDPYTKQPSQGGTWLTSMLEVGEPWERELVLLAMRTEQAEWLLSKIGEIDLAFIDGDHSFEGVKIDMDRVASRIKRGGYLCAHDCQPNFPGVMQAINQFLDFGWHHVGFFDSLGVWLRK